MARNILLSIVLAAAIVASLILFERRRQPTQTQLAPAAEAGYYLREATIEGLGEDGRHLYTLRAERIVQNPELDAVVLEDVDLEYGVGDSDPWRLTADDGQIPADGKLIALTGNVTMREQLMAGDAPTTITTASLDIDLLRHLASTTEAVDLVRGSYAISARGMQADLKAQTLRLQSEVHGRFLP